MKVRIIANPITPHGSLSKGDIIESGGQFTESYLRHLVVDARVAEFIEAKIVQPVVETKTPAKKKVKKKQKKKHKKKPLS